VAKKMVKFVELNTIGVSQDSQMRAVQILRAVILGYNNGGRSRLQESAKKNPLLPLLLTDSHHINNQDLLFHYGHSIMSYRWNQLRVAVASSTTFSLLEFSPDHCTFFGKNHIPTPGMVIILIQQVPRLDFEGFVQTQRGLQQLWQALWFGGLNLRFRFL
jgi:L-tryptophan--pyruvate aminotransferase